MGFGGFGGFGSRFPSLVGATVQIPWQLKKSVTLGP